MTLGGLAAPLDLAAPDDPAALQEAFYAQIAVSGGPDMRPILSRIPVYAEMRLESALRGRVRRAHRVRETLRTLAVSAGALAVAWGIVARRRWAAPLLGTGIAVWTGLYALDLYEAGLFPWISGIGQGMNLLFLWGLWVWLRRDDAPARAIPLE